MLTNTYYTVKQDLLQQALDSLPSDEFKMTINKPTGNFFYDPWEIKEEYKDTVWSLLVSSLPFAVGEARIIILKPATNYQTHADIDDRYHLNISGEHCYLVDIDLGKMHLLKTDGFWYSMNAGKLHSAVNFGRYSRVQLVVRQLLTNAKLDDPVTVTIHNNRFSKDDARFVFDNVVSPWLNKIQKQNKLANFNFKDQAVTFQTSRLAADELTALAKDFEIQYD
jgi:hypothetical protein